MANLEDYTDWLEIIRPKLHTPRSPFGHYESMVIYWQLKALENAAQGSAVLESEAEALRRKFCEINSGLWGGK
jgi:hypothetical protein